MDNLKSRTTELSATLGRRVAEMMGNSSELGVLKEGSIETKLLHKASRLLITKGIKDENSKYEIDRAALTIAHAMVNPINIDWDVDRYADKAKLSPPNVDESTSAGTERLKKFFPEAILGKISVPTTVVDRHGKILVVYLPNILTPSRIVCFSTYCSNISPYYTSEWTCIISRMIRASGPWAEDGLAEVVGYYVDGCTKTSGLMYWYYFVDRWAEGVVKDLLYTGGPTVDIYCIDG
ncbi:hypothetical protein F4604DRAFT_1684970 [Suillus subluteus]|nr:hypothetical protein F4604DRAFT_1684970 [Suillus subluteus]